MVGADRNFQLRVGYLDVEGIALHACAPTRQVNGLLVGVLVRVVIQSHLCIGSGAVSALAVCTPKHGWQSTFRDQGAV